MFYRFYLWLWRKAQQAVAQDVLYMARRNISFRSDNAEFIKLSDLERYVADKYLADTKPQDQKAK